MYTHLDPSHPSASEQEHHWQAQEAAMQLEGANMHPADAGYQLIHRALQADEPGALSADFAAEVARRAQLSALPSLGGFERWLPVWALMPFVLAVLAFLAVVGMPPWAAWWAGADAGLRVALGWGVLSLLVVALGALPWERRLARAA
ncbi:hypothetical protein [Piscinibacterium candidicorallinum]|uniref:DUF1707 domain-containing protein n=1 Tax=Piscinibacterium candidicorallinum TaxID=1793872 RepID=A0ABV7H778_9BURK